MNKTLLIILTAAGLSTFQSAAQALTFGDLGPYFSFAYGDGGGIPDGITNVTGQQALPGGVKLFGNLGPIDGARFRSGFVLDWTGPIEGLTNPGDHYFADISFDAQVTGGTLAWSFYSGMWSNEFASILTDLMPVPESGKVTGAHLESSQFTQSGESGFFEGYLHIDWTGYSPTDTLTLSIPQNSIDVNYVPAPEPTSMFFGLAACFLGAALRRSSSRN